MLDFLGDVGGLNDALLIIVQLALFPFFNYEIASFLMTKLFRFKKSESETVILNPTSELTSLKQSFKSLSSIKSMNYLTYCFLKWSKKGKAYNMKLRKAE